MSRAEIPTFSPRPRREPRSRNFRRVCAAGLRRRGSHGTRRLRRPAHLLDGGLLGAHLLNPVGPPTCAAPLPRFPTLRRRERSRGQILVAPSAGLTFQILHRPPPLTRRGAT